MNKAMLGCLCLLLTSISAIAELTPKVILTLPDTDYSGGSYWNKALDVNNDLHCAMYFRSGSDLTVLIFSREKTEIVKEFTIKNILPSEEEKKRVELYGLNFQSIGGSDYNEICCSQKLFNNDDLWEIVIHEYEEDDNYEYI